jgi:hypothetical protein
MAATRSPPGLKFVGPWAGAKSSQPAVLAFRAQLRAPDSLVCCVVGRRSIYMALFGALRRLACSNSELSAAAAPASRAVHTLSSFRTAKFAQNSFDADAEQPALSGVVPIHGPLTAAWCALRSQWPDLCCGLQPSWVSKGLTDVPSCEAAPLTSNMAELWLQGPHTSSPDHLYISWWSPCSGEWN